MRIEPVDVACDTALAGWHAALTAGLAEGRDDPPVWTLPEALDYRVVERMEERQRSIG